MLATQTNTPKLIPISFEYHVPIVNGRSSQSLNQLNLKDYVGMSKIA